MLLREVVSQPVPFMITHIFPFSFLQPISFLQNILHSLSEKNNSLPALVLKTALKSFQKRRADREGPWPAPCTSLAASAESHTRNFQMGEPLEELSRTPWLQAQLCSHTMDTSRVPQIHCTHWPWTRNAVPFTSFVSVIKQLWESFWESFIWNFHFPVHSYIYCLTFTQSSL